MTATTFRTVGAFEAKNTLGHLLDQVAAGETIVITRHGKPVARLVPFEEAVDRADVERAAADLRQARKGNALPHGVTVHDLIREGRR